jgi:hypothetical protein
MTKKNFRSGALTLLVLSIIACTNTVPLQNPADKFSELEQEYRFSTKELTESYLLRKLNTWLGDPAKGSQLVKEIAFASFKYPDLFRNLMRANQDLLTEINSIDAVRSRIVVDSLFKNFLESCGPVGEFQVNTFSLYGRYDSAVAMDREGNFVVAWDGSGQDGSQYGIIARRYSSTGSPLGPEFLVNTYTFGDQAYPSVAMDNDGDFVITWNSNDQEGHSHEVYAQRYGSTGSRVGSEFRVNTYTSNSQNTPAIAMDATGDFVITWVSQFQDNASYEGGIYAQCYNSSGEKQGSEFRVNTYTSGSQVYPSIAMDNGGNFVISWASYGQDGSGGGVYAQRYNSSGVTRGTEFQVNTYTTGSQMETSIAMDYEGDFVISWDSNGQDGDNSGIFAQRYDSQGQLRGTEFRVNTYTSGTQRLSAVAMDNNGDFVVTWGSIGQDGDDYGIYAQRYDNNGVPQRSEFQVNTFTTTRQFISKIAMDNGGDFVITWANYYQDANGYGYAINGKRYNKDGVPL